MPRRYKIDGKIYTRDECIDILLPLALDNLEATVQLASILAESKKDQEQAMRWYKYAYSLANLRNNFRCEHANALDWYKVALIIAGLENDWIAKANILKLISTQYNDDDSKLQFSKICLLEHEKDVQLLIEAESSKFDRSDLSKAKDWLDELVNKKNPKALSYLSRLWMAKTKVLKLHATQYDDDNSKLQFAKFFFEHEKDAQRLIEAESSKCDIFDPLRAWYWLNELADKKNPDALLYLSQLLLKGSEFVQANPKRSSECARQYKIEKGQLPPIQYKSLSQEREAPENIEFATIIPYKSPPREQEAPKEAVVPIWERFRAQEMKGSIATQMGRVSLQEKEKDRADLKKYNRKHA